MGWIITHHRAVNTPHGHLLCFQVIGSATHSLTLCLLILSKKHTITQVFTLSPVSLVPVVPMLSLLLLIPSRRPFSLPTLSPLPLLCSLSSLTTSCHLSSLSLLPVLPYGSLSLSALWTDQQETIWSTQIKEGTQTPTSYVLFRFNSALFALQCCGNVRNVSVVILNVKSYKRYSCCIRNTSLQSNIFKLEQTVNTTLTLYHFLAALLANSRLH